MSQGGGNTVLTYRMHRISPWERRELSKYAFPVLVLVHIGWNVMLNIFETERYEGLMWYLPKS